MGKSALQVLLLQLIFLLLCATTDDAEETTERKTNLNDMNISAILDSLLRGYDKRIRPMYGGPAVDVGVTMYVLSISSLSEVQMDFTMDFYFRQFWKDHRLGFPVQPGVDSLSVGAELAKKIWVPDTFFANEKTAYFHEATTSNSFLRISASGDVSRSIRLTVTATCPMNLQYFPMDRQLCTIEIESFGYTMKDIRYNWNANENSIGISPEVELPQFRVVGHRQKSKEIILTTGNYSRLACEIQFVRSMGYYLIQIYIPSSLIVMISWVSFWLNRNATPARVALGVTTVLTMTTLMSSTNAALPKISYVKSIDVFLGTCFVMVFAALIEYATVGYLGKRIQMRKTRFQTLQKLVEQRKPPLMLTESNHALTESGTLEPPPRCRADVPRHCPFGNGNTRRQLPMQLPLQTPLIQESQAYSNLDVRKKMSESKGHHHHHHFHHSGRMTPVEGQPGGHHGAPDPKDPESVIMNKNINKIHGIGPSDIDKYSRVVFPVCFICFNLMYWIIYLHISDVMAEDLIPLKTE